MPKYVIEREMPGAGKLSSDQLKEISKVSSDVLGKMGKKIEWLHSYVAEDKIYCIYYATEAALIRDHAKQAGFPANSISKISEVIDMSTAE